MFPELTQPGQHIVNIEYNYTCVNPGIQDTFVTQKTLNVYGEESTHTQSPKNHYWEEHAGVNPPVVVNNLLWLSSNFVHRC